jgi:predicted RNA-binding protein with PUA-like domain
MSYFLAKTDPETYSLDDLEREKQTVWDGVKNPQALRALRQMAPGDHVFIYHSGGQAAVVGLARVTAAGDPAPQFRFVSRLDPPATLAEIKQSRLFDDWALVRQGRLSTMAAPEAFVAWMRARYPAADI